MTAVAWLLAAVLAALLAASAAMGVSSWAAVALYGSVIAGWFVAATLAKRDVDELGGDGDHTGRTVLIFGWIGVGSWLWKRRVLRRDVGGSPTRSNPPGDSPGTP